MDLTRRTLAQSAVAGTLSLAMPAIAQPARASTLRFIPQANLTALDPIWTTATVTTNHGYYVFDTLYSVDGQMRPQPQMAAGHDVSADGRVWRIRLRDGLRFHDGTPVRSVDCVASLRRWSVVDPFGQLLAAAAEAWNTPDDRTIEIRLVHPFPLLDALGKPDSNVPFIMPERLARTPASMQVTEIVGSGPYRFVAGEYNSGSRVVYAKFDGYMPRQEPPEWGSGGKIAHFERIEWQIIPDAATASAALQAGEVDWWEQPIADLLPSLAKDRTLKIGPLFPAGQLGLMRMNCLQPPFNDVRMRRAVMMAVNQEDYMRAAFGDDRSLWSTCYSLFPHATPYYSEHGADLLKGPHDSAAVKAALQDAGYAGQKVVIINPGDFPKIEALGEVTYDALRRAGMDVDLQVGDWGTVIQRRASREPVEKGGWSIFHTYGSAAAYANPAVSPLVRGLGAKGWFGWWDSPQAETLTQQWLTAPQEADRTRLAESLNALALEQVATVPLGQGFIRTAYRADLSGMVVGNGPYPWGLHRTT